MIFKVEAPPILNGKAKISIDGVGMENKTNSFNIQAKAGELIQVNIGLVGITTEFEGEAEIYFMVNDKKFKLIEVV